ncbi:MAG: hypothetical protein HQL41_18560 [Alphaproteobacteria bacterium]|nr:hypothetical protein [Alphaproteobacteria bacterium]
MQDLIEQERERDHQPSAAVVDAEEREVLSARQRGFAEDVYGRSKGECLEEGWWRDEHRASAVWAEVRRAYEIERSRRLELEDRLGLEPHVLIENWENASRALEAFDQATLEEARNACGEPAIEEKAASRFFEEERARLEQLVAKDRSEAVRKRARQFGLLRHGVLGGFDDSSGRLWAYEQADALEQAHDRQTQRKAAAKATLEAYQRLESAEEVAREAILKSHEARKLAMDARIPVPGLPIGDIDGESLDEIVHKLSKQTSVTGYSAAMRAIGVIYNHLRRDLPTDSRSMRRVKRTKKKDDLQH